MTLSFPLKIAFSKYQTTRIRNSSYSYYSITKKSESIFLLFFSKHDQLDLLKASNSISQNKSA